MNEDLSDEELFERNFPHVKQIAQKMAAKLPAFVDIKDLIQWGSIGLLDAIQKYDRTRENKFKTYSEFRIRGAILDGLRNMDFAPRSIRDTQKDFTTVVRDLTIKFGRAPYSNELAEELGIKVEEVHERQALDNPKSILSLDETFEFSSGDRRSLLDIVTGGEDVEEKIVNKIHLKRQCELVADYFSKQTTKNASILEAYFFRAMNLKQIARMHRLSESRISQLIKLHSMNLKRLITDHERGWRPVNNGG